MFSNNYVSTHVIAKSSPFTCLFPETAPVYTVEPPLKETPNKGNLSIMNRITCPKTSLSYSANTFITSEERKPLYNEQNNLSQKLRYSEVPLYTQLGPDLH